jgi:hypothetical protein
MTSMTFPGARRFNIKSLRFAIGIGFESNFFLAVELQLDAGGQVVVGIADPGKFGNRLGLWAMSVRNGLTVLAWFTCKARSRRYAFRSPCYRGTDL